MARTVGKFKVLGRLGKGGMGEVYRAQQIELQREVALKVLSEDASAQKATERFLREAKLLAKLEHPNLVRLYDAGRAGDRLFFAMEMVSGETLTQRLSRRGRPHPAFVARVGSQMAAAFAYFHAEGLVHRDIKPSNIMIADDEAETLKLMDFGIAFEKGGERLTRTRAVVGTARYLSPEMARGQPATGKSDIYQLGLVLYELVCGAPPHSGPAAVAIARRAGGERAPDPRKAWAACPERLARLINACLEPNPDDRPTAEEIEEECEGLERKLQGWTEPEGPLEPWKPSPHDIPTEPSSMDVGGDGRNSAPLPNSGRYSEQFPEEGVVPRGRLAAVVALVLLVLVGGRWLLIPTVYRADAMVIRRGARGVVLNWSSEATYETRIRYGPEGTASSSWSTAVGKDDGRAHRLVLEGMDPAARYLFHVVFPSGETSLDYSFQAPAPFRVHRNKFRIVGEDALEWRFQTPVEVLCRLEITASDGTTLERKESEAAEEHVFRFRYAEMLRPPREVRARFEAADGPVEVEFPMDQPLSLVDHLIELLSQVHVDWPEFFNRAEERREDAGQLWSGQGLPKLQGEVQELVKKTFGRSGMIENWAAVSPAIGDYLGSAAPWSERRELLDALLNLTLVDRLYELYSLPPFFQTRALLLGVARALPREPDWGAGTVTRTGTFPYDKNMLVAMNYSARGRERINSFSMTFLPQKGEVQQELETSFEMPAGDWSQLAFGMECRGIYPFSAVMVDVLCGQGDFDRAPTYPFLSEKELTDVPIANEMDLIKYGQGIPMDEIFPVRRFWMQVPPEAACPGENRVRIRLLSLQHLSFFPAVARRFLVFARPKTP